MTVKEVAGVHIILTYKYDDKLCSRWAKSAKERKLTYHLLTNEDSLFTSFKTGAGRTEQGFFCLSMSVSTTTHITTRSEANNCDKISMLVSDGEGESADKFPIP